MDSEDLGARFTRELERARAELAPAPDWRSAAYWKTNWKLELKNLLEVWVPVLLISILFAALIGPSTGDRYEWGP